MIRRILLVTAIASLSFASVSSAAVTKGTSMFALQLGSGTADLYTPSASPPEYITAYDHSELDAQVQYWKMLADDYAFAISAGIGFFSEKDEPGDAAPPNFPDQEYKQSSFNVRIGGDRVVNLGERAVLYFGPGIEYWSGKSEFTEMIAAGTVESENVTRIGLAGRVGLIMNIGSNWGFTGSIGHKMGLASAEDRGAKATWWPSSFDGQGGLVFMFGGQ